MPVCIRCGILLTMKPVTVALVSDDGTLDGSALLPKLSICWHCGVWQTPTPVPGMLPPVSVGVR